MSVTISILRTDANFTTVYLCVLCPGLQGADSRHTDVCVCVRVDLCVSVDGWAGRARPRIRVQTNWVIYESDRGAVMGPTLRLLMHADRYWQPFVS